MTLFWLIFNILAVPLGISAHVSPWLTAINAACVGGLSVLLIFEKRGLV